MEADSPTKPKSKGGKKPVKCTTASCPLVGYKLIEIVEVVKQTSEKLVKGSGMNSTNTTLFTETVTRKDKKGSSFKQYINIEQDINGQSNRHPEYGRKICFRARIKQKNGKTDKLSGIAVNFTSVKTNGPHRSNPSGGKNVWKDATGLKGNQKHGFDSENGLEKKTVSTDSNGWTSIVSFYVSQYGGDKFKISAKMDPTTKGADSNTIHTKNYQVWKKFWYQMTYADSYLAKTPTKAASAYAQVYTDMVKTNTKKFKKEDFSADLQGRTFMKEYMLKVGGANKTIANVGTGNISDFSLKNKLKLDIEPTKYPIKENLIVCEYQCDAKPQTAISKYKLTSDGQSIKIIRGTSGSIISKPAVKAGATLVVTGGEWSRTKIPWARGGSIDDTNISIDSGRTTTLHVKVTLPSGAPTPTVAAPVYVKLQLETAKNYLGWATSAGIVCVYRPSAAAGKSGSEEDYNDTVAHEFGHKWKQTPKPSIATGLNMEKHPNQYVGHGGSGSHCRHGATVAAGTVNWQDKNEKTPSPSAGDCIMFHSYSSSCSHEFCDICKPYLQLQDMKSF